MFLSVWNEGKVVSDEIREECWGKLYGFFGKKFGFYVYRM